MKKYRLIFLLTLSQFTTYRLQVFAQFLNSSLPLAITWVVLSFAASASISSAPLISYYILVSLTAPLSFSAVDEELEEITFTGQVNNFLLQPLSLFRWLLAKSLSEKIISLLFLFPLILLAIWSLGVLPGRIFFAFLSLFISFLLSFSLSFLVGLGCFWIDEFWAVRNVKYVVTQLLGGLVLPYAFFPSTALKIIHFTPFPYLIGWAGRILNSGYLLSEFIIASFWLIIIVSLTRLLLRQAINKYSFTGG